VGNLGLAQGNLGDYEGARVAHREVRMAARSLGDSRVEGKGLANEAMIDIWEGDARSAIERLDTARILYRRTAYNAGEEHALGQLATAYELTGEENRSFALLDSALDLSRKLGMVDEELDNVRLLAGLHLRLGDTRRALEIYRDAEARMRKAGLTETWRACCAAPRKQISVSAI
jgi:tetratricopeptide (TPR) repeat protein